VGAALPLLAAQAPARHVAALQLRPNPQTTVISGSQTGPVLDVNNSASNPLNVYGIVGSVTGGPYGIGLVGYGANPSSGNIGVTGLDGGPGGYGAIGLSTYSTSAAPTSATQTTGVYGISSYGSGVWGQTQRLSTSPPGQAGVTGTDGTNDDGYNDGVLGITTSGEYGVEGDSSDDAAGGVRAVATTGYGLYASSGSGTGLYASSSTGVGGEFVSGSTLHTLYVANSTTGDGILSNSSTGVAVSGTANSAGIGVLGQSNGSYGVEGITQGTSTSSAAAVVGMQYSYNDGSCGDLCHGSSGVFGSTDAFSDGTTLTGGVFGTAHYALVGYPADSAGFSFVGLNTAGDVVYAIDNHGTVHTGGAVETLGGTRSMLHTSHGYYANAYGAETLSRTLEDENSGEVVNGGSVVHIDPAFTEAVGSANYQVFLTPDGDCNGLYVSAKTPTSFVVRELRGGRSTLAFDYRIVAHPYGHAAERMQVASSLAALSEADALLGTGSGGHDAHAELEARTAAARHLAQIEMSRAKAPPMPAKALASARHVTPRTIDFSSFLRR
jgi:hypothetical protein